MIIAVMMIILKVKVKACKAFPHQPLPSHVFHDQGDNVHGDGDQSENASIVHDDIGESFPQDVCDDHVEDDDDGKQASKPGFDVVEFLPILSPYFHNHQTGIGNVDQDASCPINLIVLVLVQY